MKPKALFRAGTILVGLLLLPAGAHAQRVSLKSATIIEPPEKAPVPEGASAAYPSVEVKVGGDPGLRLEDFVAKFPDQDPPVTIKATKVVPFRDSNEQMYMLILVQGTQRFMGASPDPEEQARGYHEPVKQAIDVFAHARDKNTQVAVWVYKANPDKKVDFTAPSSVSADAIGGLNDFSKDITKGLNAALQRATAELSGKQGRRVLVLIGDGEDQSDTWKPGKDNKAGLDAAAIEVYVLGAGPGVTDPRNGQNLAVLGALGAVQIANQREQVKDLADALANNLNNVYTVTFPGYQESDQQRMPWDGNEHELVVGVKREDTGGKTLSFRDIPFICPSDGPFTNCVCANRLKPDPQRGCASGGGGWWIWLLVGLGALIVILLVVVLLIRKKGGEEIIEAPPEPVVAAPPPPAVPAGPQKTQALFLGDDNSQPVVGWIVPTGGPAAWQTFKLSSRTIIGTAPDATVNVGDAYMSGQHAEILMNANGFILMDRGSQNGVIVNSRRVTQHELVDNDVFTCGRTEFKFKSIT